MSKYVINRSSTAFKLYRVDFVLGIFPVTTFINEVYFGTAATIEDLVTAFETIQERKLLQENADNLINQEKSE